MLVIFVAAQANTYPVRVVCRVLGVARSSYYAWKRRPISPHAKQDAVLTTQIQTVFRASRRTYGSPRVHATLQAQGVRCSRKRVARLMGANALVARRKQQRVCTTDSRYTQPIAANELARNFQTDAPNQVWVAAITYLPTREGWLYLAVVLDLYARRVVGWSMDMTLERSLVLRALQHALARRQPRDGLLHLWWTQCQAQTFSQFSVWVPPVTR